MKQMLALSAAALALAACGEPGDPQTESAASVSTVPTIDPTEPVRPGDGPDSFVGTWAANADWCANTSAMTDQVPIRITTDRFEGYETRCDITAIEQAGDSYDVTLACEAEGMTSRERVNMRVVEDRLTLTWSDRGGEPVQLMRCATG